MILLNTEFSFQGYPDFAVLVDGTPGIVLAIAEVAMFIVIILDGVLYIEQEGPEGQKTLLARMLPGHLFPTSSR